MPEPISTDTIYNFSGVCKKCGDVVSPVKKVFTGNNKDLCPECKNDEFSKSLKRGLG